MPVNNAMQKTFGLKASLMLVTSLTIMSGATIAPSLPEIAREYGDNARSEYLSKLILTVPALAIAVCGTFAGMLVDRFGRKNLLLFGLMLYAVAGISGYFLDDIFLILVGRALLGVSVALVMTIATTLVGDYFVGPERHKFLGYQGGFMALGGMVFVGFGGLLADFHWRFPFLLYLFSLVVLPLAAYYLYEPANKEERLEIREEATPDYPKPIVNLIYITVFLYMVVFYMIPVQIPFLLEDIGVKKYLLAGLAIAIGTIAAAVTAFFYQKMRARLHYSKIYAIGFILIGIGYGIVSISHTYLTVISGLIVSGFGVGALMPNANLWLLSVVPEKIRGKAVGKITAALFLGQFFSPILVQPLVKMYNLHLVFGAVGIFTALMGIGYAFSRFRDQEMAD